jgi:prepilin-type N-terminal cleavage/methylation domain-containing protein
MVLAKNEAFTLVELLVVIAIVGLLSTIVLAVTSGASEQGRIAKSLQFSKQIENILGSGLVGRWNFDEGADNTCSDGKDICDSSGWGNNGVLINSPTWRCNDAYTPSGKGCSLEFDGVNVRYAEVASHNSLGPEEEITNEVWFKLYTLSNTATVLAKDNPAPTNYWIDIRNGGTSIYVGGYTSDSSVCYEGATVPALLINTWYHLAWTYDRQNMKTYLNGNLINNVGRTCVLNKNEAPLRIGTRNGTSNLFPGLIDEVKIYSIVLTASQIQSQYCVGLDSLLVRGLIGEKEYWQRLIAK